MEQGPHKRNNKCQGDDCDSTIEHLLPFYMCFSTSSAGLSGAPVDALDQEIWAESYQDLKGTHFVLPL